MLVTSQSDHIFWRQSKRNGLCRAVARPVQNSGRSTAGGPHPALNCLLKRTAGRLKIRLSRECSLSRACWGQQSVGLRALTFKKAFPELRTPVHHHKLTHERCQPAPYTSPRHMRFACACCGSMMPWPDSMLIRMDILSLRLEFQVFSNGGDLARATACQAPTWCTEFCDHDQ